MKSTGEVMGRDKLYAKALYKGLIGAGMKIPAMALSSLQWQIKIKQRL